MADEDLAIEDLAIEAAPVAIFDLAIVDRSAPRSAPGLLRKFLRSCAPKNPVTDCGTTTMFPEF